MDHRDHVALLAGGVPEVGGVWADFGCGDGAFTLALRDLAGPDTEIFAVDRDGGALRSLERAMERRFPGTALHTVAADFRVPVDLPPLDGIVAANSLHFVPREQQVALLALWRELLGARGRLILVEYDADEGNRWVPYPISFVRLGGVAHAAGYVAPVRLAERRTRILHQMYSAVLRPERGGQGSPPLHWRGEGDGG